MHRKRFFLLLLVFIPVLSTTPSIIHAEPLVPFSPSVSFQENTCTELVRDAFSQLGTNCADTEFNSICYGFSTVTPSFLTLDETLLSEPGDTAELTDLESVMTSPLNTENSEYGIALLKIQADIHSSIEPSTFILIGEGQLESAVTPENQVLPIEPINVTTATVAQAFAEPGGEEVVGEIPIGETLLADGISVDGDFVRVLFEAEETKLNAWVNVADLESVETVDLPTFGPDSRTPMQAFYLDTSTANEACLQETAPPLLLVQTPSEFKGVNIKLNEIDVSFEEATTVFHLSAPDTLEVYSLGGMTTLFPDTTNELLVPPGYKTQLCLRPAEDLGVEGDIDDKGLDDTCGQPSIQPISQADIDLLTPLEDLPTNVTNRPVHIPVIIIGSGIGEVIAQIIFDNPQLLAVARRLCEEGILPVEICTYLGLP
jgi:hypothetical protein